MLSYVSPTFCLPIFIQLGFPPAKAKLALHGMEIQQIFSNSSKNKLEQLYTVVNKDFWDKVFKSGLSEFCARQPLENFKRYAKLDHIPSNILKAALHKIYLVHS